MLPLKPPVSKNKLEDIKLLPFPIYNENGEIFDESTWPKYKGIFNGKIIIVNDSNDISRLSNSGSFGQSGVFNKNTFLDYKTLQNQIINQKKNWHAMELIPYEFPSNKESKEVKNVKVENELVPYEFPSNEESKEVKNVKVENELVPYEFPSNEESKEVKNVKVENELVPYEFPSNEESKEVKNVKVENDRRNFQSLGESSMSNQNMTAECIQKIDLLKQIRQTQTHELDFSAIYLQERNMSENIVVDGTPANWKDLKTNFNEELNDLLLLSGCKHNVNYYLLLEEAFFLCYTLECLEIQGENGLVIKAADCWKHFNSLKKNFPFYYAAYHYYRSKEWVVKPGQQYGGDYVLYKLSPLYYHSSYVVVISINGQNSELLSSWPMWFGCNRVIEAANKDLLICSVHGPLYEEGMPIDLTQYTVTDTIVRRWTPSQNRKKP